MPDTSRFLLRWALGRQNTVKLSDISMERFKTMLWLSKLSIASFQKWFPDADFVLLYNGDAFDEFVGAFEETSPLLLKKVHIVDQVAELNNVWDNPYHYWPMGVWWKWLPFRLDLSKNEIAVDTDIICLSRPDNWYDWAESGKPVIIAPERFKTVKVNTCGDLWDHPLVKDKQPFNCGVVGQLAEHDYAERFFETTKMVRIGETHDSMFITEQGVVNVWVRSLEVEGIQHYCLDFQRNAWIRDFLFFMINGVRVETVHATTWHKDIVRDLRPVFERRVFDDGYSDEAFLSELMAGAKELDAFGKGVLYRQIGAAEQMDVEFVVPGR